MTDRTTTLEPLLNTKEAAALLGMHPRTLIAWRSNSASGPRFVKMGKRRVAYHPDDLRAWLAQHRRTSTSDPGPVVQMAEPVQPRSRRPARRRRRS